MEQSHERVLVLGATGSIGRAVTKELVTRGYEVTALVRDECAASWDELAGAKLVVGDACDEDSLRRGFGEGMDVVVSCVASRSGTSAGVWEVDYGISKRALDLLIEGGGVHFVLLSALCVRTPVLELHRAKLAIEADLQALPSVSGCSYTIVRPTSYMKSLAGQLASASSGQPYLLFGDGSHTRTNPISDRDLATYMVDQIAAQPRVNQLLELGGPGPSISPREQADLIFELTGLQPQFINVPLIWLDYIVSFFESLAKLAPFLEDGAEAARIARFYATEPLLCDVEVGSDTVRDYYEAQLSKDASSRVGLGLPTSSLLALRLLKLFQKPSAEIPLEIRDTLETPTPRSPSATPSAPSAAPSASSALDAPSASKARSLVEQEA